MAFLPPFLITSSRVDNRSQRDRANRVEARHGVQAVRQGLLALELARDRPDDTRAERRLLCLPHPGLDAARDLAEARVQELAHRGQRDYDVTRSQLGARPDEGRREGPSYVTVVAQLGECWGSDGGHADDAGVKEVLV